MEQTEKQLPLRRAETAAAFITCVQAAAGGLALLLGRLSASDAAEAAAWQFFAGVLLWLGALIHQRLRRLAIEEGLAAEAVGRGVQGQMGPALFEAEAADLLTARNRLAQFEKYFLPAFSILVILVLSGVSYFGIRWVLAPPVAPPGDALRNFWAFAGIAFALFLLAKYAAGMATQAPWRPLRPAANYTMACALSSLLVAIGFVFCYFEVPVAEQVVAWAIPVAMGAVAFEMLLLLVMGAYRPRVAGEEARPAHDSRLLGMLTTSRGILRTTAETLDYQFGFKVSETWFYRFMERALGPLILFQAVTLGLLTCFVIVDTGEQAIIERFGVPRASHRSGRPLGPGLHLKWPWPIEVAHRYPTARVESIAIGEQLKEDAPGYVWTQSHAKEPFNLLAAIRRAEAASPKPSAPAAPDAPRPAAAKPIPGVGILTGTVHVLYYVDNYYEFLYEHEDPRRALEAISYRELTRYSANSDFMEFLGHGLQEAVEHLKDAIQKAARAKKLGVRILDVALQGLHPPVEVARAFEEVVGALEEKEAKVWAAQGYANTVRPQAEQHAARAVAEARIYAADRQYVAPAARRAFEMLLEAYRTAPSVFKHRKLLSVLEETLVDARKLIKPTWAGVHEVVHINLEEKMAPGVGLSTDMGITEGMTP